MRILVLCGTTEARELTTNLAKIAQVEIITSLAGRTHSPSKSLGDVRVGGFGGVSGLVNYLQEMDIDVLIDATHPFAQQMAENAAKAAKTVKIPHLKLLRPSWEKVEGDSWIEVPSLAAAAQSLTAGSQRVFLTIGRQELKVFANLPNIWFLMRMIDSPTSESIIPLGKILCDRGPFSLENEKEILINYRIDTIVSKNSGGDATYAKIVAARELQIPVIIVQRPLYPETEQVTNINDAIKWWERVVTEGKYQPK